MVDDALNPRELSWREYRLMVDLYKYHASALLRLNAFHYAVTGAIMSFCLSHDLHSAVRWGLALPIAYSIGLTVVFFFARPKVRYLAAGLEELAKNLGLFVPDFDALYHLLTLYGIIHGVTALALIVLLIWPGLLSSPPPNPGM